MILLRWGRSAYETPESIATEERLLAALGVELRPNHLGPEAPVEEVEILALTSKVRVTAELLERAPKLKLVVTTTSGHEHIDAAACAARGVRVARCPLARRDAVVDTSLALGLSLLRAMPTLQERAEEGIWARGELPSLSMRLARGLPVGVVGHGVIGARAAQVWRALGAQVWVSDPKMKRSPSILELAENCPLITLHCDLNPSSARLVDARVLEAMQPGAILLNTARGGLVDTDALMEVDHLGGVGLDVFPEEPFPRIQELARRPRTLLLPHAAGYHEELGLSVARELAATVGAFLAGKALPHQVSV